MSSPISRAEALSVLSIRKLSATQLQGDPVIDISVDQSNKDIVITFAKSGQKRILRAANSVPQSSVVTVAYAGYNAEFELVVVLSNNEIYNFGRIAGDPEYVGASGTGFLASTLAGHPIFKPLVGSGDVVVSQEGVTLVGSIDPDQSFNVYARFYEKTRYTHTPPADTWVTRSLRESDIFLPGTSLASNIITLPAGEYYAQGWCVSYRTNFLRSRLFDVTNNRVLVLGMTSLSKVGTGYNVETYSRFGGKFILLQPTQIVLQALVSVPFSEHSITPTGNQVEIWRLK